MQDLLSASITSILSSDILLRLNLPRPIPCALTSNHETGGDACTFSMRLIIWTSKIPAVEHLTDVTEGLARDAYRCFLSHAELHTGWLNKANLETWSQGHSRLIHGQISLNFR